MSFLETHFTARTLAHFAAAEDAIAALPPAFPLAATVAVNPFLGQAGESRAHAAARLERVAGVRTTQDRSALAAAIADGRISAGDVDAAAAAAGLAAADLHEGALREAPAPEAGPTLADLAAEATGVDWPGLIEDRIGLWAGAHFDRGQALWPAPGGRPYASWRSFARRDLTVGIAGLSGFAERVAGLPDDVRAGFGWACETLDLTPEASELYFHRLLMTLGGWAQIARAEGWLAERDGGRDTITFELLTIRLIWEAALLDRFGESLGAPWAAARDGWEQPVAPSADHLIDTALQEAADRAAERRLAELLAAEAPAPAEARPASQAAFCIDVRSEIFRRALESTGDDIRTIGFAGFFGLAAGHREMASDLLEARAPVLLQTGVESTTSADADADRALRLKKRAVRAWNRFKMATVSAFAFVEAAGPIYVGKLLKDTQAKAKSPALMPAPKADMPLSARIVAAATILRAMSLTGGFARVVLVAGHGSTVTNAPHASALQCGACGGHAGDVNARLLAGLLNDAEVRAGLAAEEGIEIPADTLFVAGLHDTVSDEVTLFEDSPSPDHKDDLARLKQVLKQAAKLARGERALTLPRAAGQASLPARGGDWSELRPEWGLAGCSAFIAAPRERTAGRHLGGRAFLHSYDWRADEARGFPVLELILTAPVVVASWISLQYHGSSVAPAAFGGGNKLIHNVVGGVGVVEGNGGILRPGLPFQSVHDGERLRHEPLRLSVVVEAPAAAISAILDRHPGVRALFDNGWLSLHVMDDSGRLAARYDRAGWQRRGMGAMQPESAAA
ncbi:YbcC family protein [Histidinibacterium lentulum]|uniref:Probable inorganic carbon transporter subunit DabA n=1 Tax=Histidinibacterium lentulum TaxID=2480588 RepID=A0A3N2R8K7_9RHOB|nr:DUF2309 domain-containing protein [Histidinibacterium lentulum]ROU03721.1 DUF2309 domain-containing protein [Histidinibacterium lentulum]